MALQARYCSCPRLSARQVGLKRNAPSRAARLTVRPGVHNTAAAAEDIAVAAVGQVAGQQQLHHLSVGQHHDHQQCHVLSQLDAASSNSIVQLHHVSHSSPHAAGRHSCWEHVQHSSSLTEAAATASQLQLELLPDGLEQQQQHQQQLEWLESSGNASTTYSTSTPQHSGTNRHHSSAAHIGNRLGSSSSNGSSEHIAAAGSRHAHRPQQGSQDTHNTAGSSSSRSSSDKSLPGLQLVRPSGRPAVAGARSCSPAQLAALSAALRATVPETQQLLGRHPQLLSLQAAAVQAAIQQLAAALNIQYNAAAFMCCCYPKQYLLRPAGEVYKAAVQLAAQLQLPGAHPVAAAAVAVPGLLARPQAGVLQRLHAICSWFNVSPAGVLAMVAAAPELLTDSAPSIQRRAAALGAVFRLKPVCVQRMVAAHPPVLFLSPRIMNNKLKVLMAILQKDARIVGSDIVYKTPQLLRRNLDKVRVCYQLLPIVLQRHEGFIFAMAAHNGRLLLLPAGKLLVRGARLQAALECVPEWQQQWQQLRPPQVEQGFAANYSRFERLEYLISTQQAGSIGVLSALKLSNEAFQQQFSSWGSWWQAKQERLKQGQQQQQWQVQQGQQQQQQQHGNGFAAGPLMQAGPQQQQQQQQQQYQQLVHQHLRRMQHLHRQRQLQLQQHRALVLQQRALQWQQLQKQKHLQQRQGLQLQQQRTALQVQGMQLQHIARAQQQQQQHVIAQGGYIWGRHSQPSQQQQQQWQEQYDWLSTADQPGEEGALTAVGSCTSAMSQPSRSVQHAQRAAGHSAAAASGTDSSFPDGSSSSTGEQPLADCLHNQAQLQQQQQQQPIPDGTQARDGQLASSTPSNNSSSCSRSRSSSSNSRVGAEDVLVTPQRQQQQQQRTASYMLGPRGTNGSGRVNRQQQLPVLPEQQRSQQMWQPAAAAARLGGV